ncbi:profilin [Diaporthe sp. PMI_573]|nr:profilin [Diaporthaceae sp. PMI_573]
MAWQAYMESSLLGTGAVDQIIIFERNGRKVLASSMGFLVSDQEQDEIKLAYDCNKSGTAYKKSQNKGLQVAGQTFRIVKADSRSLYGTKDEEGVCIVRTKTAMLVAHFGRPSYLEEAARCVEQLCDNLIEKGS